MVEVVARGRLRRTPDRPREKKQFVPVIFIFERKKKVRRHGTSLGEKEGERGGIKGHF